MKFIFVCSNESTYFGFYTEAIITAEDQKNVKV